MLNTITVTIDKKNRDYGKKFVITEMPAAKSEKWAMRAILALLRGGMNLPEGFEYNGMAALIGLAVKDLLPALAWQDAEPLLDEMMQCVEYIPEPAKPNIKRKLFDTDIEEISTRFDLRLAVWDLHTDFLRAENPPASNLPNQA